MIIKLEKNINDLKIGLLGFRSDILKDTLNIHNIENCINLETHEDIDETFDLVLMSGVYYIIPEEYINKPKYGTFGFHESYLPEGRGSSPIYWTIKTNRINFTVSMFKADKHIDEGMIVLQYNVGVDQFDTYESIDKKRVSAIQNTLSIFIDELKSGVIVLRPQSGKSSYVKKRNPMDSELDSTKPLIELWDDIRCCDNSQFPAYFVLDGRKIFIFYKVEDDNK